ncbi:MAG: tRNA pseudouridine(13) synthase TruD [Candidatus Thermoplasmatota archaeon]|nr:tRNA pseudouridine(13) synthase TruD [Candidatus Thermoplasmatota archaeon]MBU1940278.1 tRNA pseudouridine(13) synthase TruD [Candidatus Thermoplasmatota archaeon]
MRPAPVEQQLGITTFYTTHPGLGGTLRAIPQDFQVREHPQLPPENPTGRYLLTWVESTNWDTHLLVKELSRRLHISQQRIQFAGTKDKHAVTTQLMTIADCSTESLTTLSIKDVTLTPLYQVQQPLHLGDLKGNQFTIIIRDITPKKITTILPKYLHFFHETPGFPNYFGIQRFGGIRPITHLIGKHLTQGDITAAVMSYLSTAFPQEDPHIQTIRNDLRDSHDFLHALNQFPRSFRYERALLSSLVQNPTSYVDALQVLPKNLLLMFINAYQSYLFNQMISQRLKKQLPIHQALIGDIVLPVKQPPHHQESIQVTTENLTKVNRQIEKNHARVSGLLFGNSTRFAEGEMGEIERHIIDQEGLEPHHFIISDIPFLSSSGTRRAIYTSVKELQVSHRPDALHNGKYTLNLSFSLDKGCYASVFLREWMKSSDITKY